MYLGRSFTRIKPASALRLSAYGHVHNRRSFAAKPTKFVLNAEYLDNEIKSGNSASVRALYLHVKSGKGTGDLSTLNEHQLTGILAALARSGDNNIDLVFMHNILAEMPDRFGVDLNPHIHSAIFDAFVEGNHVASYRWLLKMRNKITPTLSQWHKWINTFVPPFEQFLLPHKLVEMETSGCPPTAETYRLILTRLFTARPHLNVVKSILEHRSKRFPYDPSLSVLLSQGYTRHGSGIDAEKVAALYQALYQTSALSFNEKSINKLRRAYGNKKRRGAAAQECEALRRDGFVPTIDTLKALTASAASHHDLQSWESITGVQADLDVWNQLIRNCAQGAEAVDRTVDAYETLISTGLIPNSETIHPVMRALCVKSLRPPSEKDLDRALVLYQQFFRLASFGEPNAAVYNTLISALASAPNKTRYFPQALGLLEDMKSRGVIMDSMTATSIVVLLMRSSASPSEAFQAYRKIHKGSDGLPTLDAEGYVAVLNVFCRLTFGKLTVHSSIPAWEQYFDIVKDMRKAGYPVNVKVYSIILQQLGLAATKFRQADKPSDTDDPVDMSQLQRAISKVHQLLTLDPSIQPDTIAWNTLMDAYQRAGCLSEAYRVWDSLWITRNFDNASVSIIADACGHGGAVREAHQIFTRLYKVGFPMNIRNWNSWIECLCRLGQYEDAIKVVCLDMGKDGKPEADEESIKIVLRFISGTREESEIRGRLKRYLPKLWTVLPKHITE